MDDKTIKRDEGIGIDLQNVLGALMKKAWLIGLVSILSAVVILLATFFLVTPKYESSAMFYVNNSNLSVGDASFSISSGDISAAKSLVDSYIIILETRESLHDVIDYAGVNRTYAELKEMISAASVNSTEIFEVVVTSPDPAEAEKIANAIAYILPKRISSIIEGTSAKVVDAAVIASKPSSPNYTSNALIGFLLGFILSVGVIVLREMFDIAIRAEEDIANICSYPVLTSVPDMLAPGKGGYYYGSTGKKPAGAKFEKRPNLVDGDIGFAASEAYKLLRTKLQYSFSGDGGCRVIGVSSALTGEGKSLTAVNLACTQAMLGKRVLLIDCDMRRPSVHDKLPVQKSPGLSGFLSGQKQIDSLIQRYTLSNNENTFDVIAAGQNPPNPIELLSSTRMNKMLQVLREHYDYIILDMPPVGEVSDALAVAKETDGILLVTRQNYCDRLSLGEAVRQFEFVESKILGVVYNCVAASDGQYSKRYYKKYGYAQKRYAGYGAQDKKAKH